MYARGKGGQRSYMTSTQQNNQWETNGRNKTGKQRKKKERKKSVRPYRLGIEPITCCIKCHVYTESDIPNAQKYVTVTTLST